MSRTRVRWGRVGVALTTVSVAVSLLAGRAGAGGSDPPRPETYVVQRGDTLWAIASKLAGPTRDPRPVVDRLAKANHAESGFIRVGQILVLPEP